MQKIKPVPVAHKYKKRAFLFKDLNSCTHVHLRNMARKSLERPYTEPHRVIKRTSDRVYEIEVNGESRQVSVENILPAFFLREDICNIAPTEMTPKNVDNSAPKAMRTYARKKTVSFNDEPM